MLHILSLDGGPAPMLQIHLLRHLEAKLRRERRGSLLARADLLSGTSDGALVAIYLAKHLGRGEPVDAVIEGAVAFMDRYIGAFHDDMRTADIAGTLAQVKTILDERLPFWTAPPGFAQLKALAVMPAFALADLARAPLFGAARELFALRDFLLGRAPLNPGAASYHAVLGEEFGEETLGSVRRHVAVVAFDTKEWAPRIFRNFGDSSTPEGRSDLERDLRIPLVDVIRATMSLPLMFTIFGGPRGEDQRGYLDGLFAANNTATSALSLAIRHLVAPGLAPGENPLDAVKLLSLGVSQTEEEATLERGGGLLRTLVLLLSQERETRLIFSVKPSELMRYIREPASRADFHAKLEGAGIGEAAWGYRELLARPTLVGNFLIHGLNEEVSRQCQRLLGAAHFHRYKVRINLARSIFTLIVMRKLLSEMDIPWNAKRCLGEQKETLSFSTDEQVNFDRTVELEAWLDAHWLPAVESASARVESRPDP
jgi:predicted acylesterase/phospholipase RssA